jgi:hypothetical protein
LKLPRLGFKIKELNSELDWRKREGFQTEGIRQTSGQIIFTAAENIRYKVDFLAHIG